MFSETQVLKTQATIAVNHYYKGNHISKSHAVYGSLKLTITSFIGEISKQQRETERETQRGHPEQQVHAIQQKYVTWQSREMS